jgi:hypothetical protein
MHDLSVVVMLALSCVGRSGEDFGMELQVSAVHFEKDAVRRRDRDIRIVGADWKKSTSVGLERY